MQRIIEGQVFRRRDVAVLFGGNARAFLPRVAGGDVVAGCFDPAMNPRLPSEVLVHNAPNAVLAAKRFVEQCKIVQSPKSKVQGREAGRGRPSAFSTQHSTFSRGAVPVFVKLEPNVWKFVGHFRALRYVTEQAAVAERVYEIRPRIYEKYVREYGEMKGILFLEQV